MKKLFGFLILSLLLPFSCKKEDNPSKTDLLTTHCWILTAATINPAAIVGGAVVTDLYALLPLCGQDNISCIRANGSFFVDEGASKCDANDPQINSSGKWWFNADETVVFSLDDNSTDTIPTEILELSATTLRFRQTLEVFGADRQITFSYEPE